MNVTNGAIQKTNETAAVWAIADIRRMQNEYSVKNVGKYAPTFDELIKAENLDDAFRGEQPVVSGYVFRMTVSTSYAQGEPFYVITAEPSGYADDESIGRIRFYTDSTLGTIHATRENRSARPNDPTF